MAEQPLVPGLRIGHAQDEAARTGCTVLLGPFRAAADVRGMATGTRELEALSLLHVAPVAHAILLTGGSAFGLAATDGVLSWLEERGVGFDTPAAQVPIVPAAVIYDLAEGSANVRPDPAMGRAACDAARADEDRSGRIGAGCGATVGKLLGPEHAMPGGLGTFTTYSPAGGITAVAVVNAVGDVRAFDGRIIAGARTAAGFVDSAAVLRRAEARPPRLATSTTLVAVVTAAPIGRPELQALARMAAAGVPRRIDPVHTILDGDVVFAASTSPEQEPVSPAALLALGALAAHAVEHAIVRAVSHA